LTGIGISWSSSSPQIHQAAAAAASIQERAFKSVAPRRRVNAIDQRRLPVSADRYQFELDRAEFGGKAQRSAWALRGPTTAPSTAQEDEKFSLHASLAPAAVRMHVLCVAPTPDTSSIIIMRFVRAANLCVVLAQERNDRGRGTQPLRYPNAALCLSP